MTHLQNVEGIIFQKYLKKNLNDIVTSKKLNNNLTIFIFPWADWLSLLQTGINHTDTFGLILGSVLVTKILTQFLFQHQNAEEENIWMSIDSHARNKFLI